ncbi:ABC transporter substrate-binding protein [Streptomyces polygonati]|uniref:non-specific serine/threonine protein kinase n=1 Tax=Streptomyces polygonati TaxID=1617087 RepID=A0ABV8HES3_9ACTN
MADGLFAGRYELAELLGSGGMARVHRARDTRMGRTVAVKTLHAELAGDPGARQRFAREARAAGALNHPGIVTVHDQDETSDGDAVVPFLVMEYVPGITLAQLLRKHAQLPPERAVRIVCDVLDALAHAHSHGTVHRDVKPANVMITEEGAVKVTDFGIARVLHSDTRLTATGSAIGTPSYMSPEQINGGDVDARSDVYAAGCVLFELLTGRPPFIDGNPLSLMYRHVHTPPPAPSSRDPRVPKALDDLVLAALAKDPADRPPTAAAYRDRLLGWLAATGAAALTGPAAAPEAVARSVREGAPGPAAGHGPGPRAGQDALHPSAPRPADPRATFGVGAKLPVLPPAPDRRPDPAPAGPEQPPYSRAASSPVSPASPAFPAPRVPPPRPPATPPPFELRTSPVTDRGRVRRRWIAAGAGVAVAAVGVGLTLAFAPLGGDRGDQGDHGGKSSGGPTATPTVRNAALALHGGKQGSGYNGGLDGVVRPSTTTGGTLHLVSDYPPAGMLDPAASYDTTSWNVQRLYLRKLVDYAPAPGPAGRKLVPDLATDTGHVSSDGLTWTFHLKPGLLFDDGTPITSKDVKYGVERTFARDTFSGPSYFVDLLDQGQHYPGPYEDDDPDGLGLHSVATPDDTTVVFTLAKPFADFRYVLALSMGAPIPRAADTGDGKDFQHHPVGSGPYKVADYDSGKSVELVRNPYWKQSTDSVHSALPDAIDLKFVADQSTADAALLSGTADLDIDNTGLSDATVNKVLGDNALKADTDLVYNGATRFLSLQTSVAPFDDYRCRQAVQYAVDRLAVRTAFGGPTSGGDIATTMLPPTVDGHDPDAAPYTTAAGAADPDTARTQLAGCGEQDGFDITLAGVDSAQTTVAMDAISRALRVVGITVKVKAVDATDFYKTLHSPDALKSKKWGMVLTSWAADWPTGGGFLRALVQPGGYADYSGLDDADLNDAVDQADTETDPAGAADAWKAIDKQVMAESTMVPLLYERHPVYHSPRLTNVYEQQVLGGVDLTALGVQP